MRVLTIVHQADAGPGVFLDAIADAGADLHEWRSPEQPEPPRGAGDFDAVIALGGAVHPDQEAEHPWLATEQRLLAEVIATATPLLGVCLGAELVALAAGGTVRRASTPEIGWHRVRVSDTAADDPVVGPLADHFEALEWHSYECVPPPTATALAHSDSCLQAFRSGPAAWGIQFHAEVTAEDLETWITGYGTDEDAVGLDPDAFRSQSAGRIEAWNELGRAVCARFLDEAGRRS